MKAPSVTTRLHSDSKGELRKLEGHMFFYEKLSERFEEAYLRSHQKQPSVGLPTSLLTQQFRPSAQPRRLRRGPVWADAVNRPVPSQVPSNLQRHQPL